MSWSRSTGRTASSRRAIQASREVELEAGSGDRVVLDVNVRTNKEHLTAERLNIAGYVVGAAGLALEIVALSVDASSDAESALVWGGVAAAATAVALTITSYVMLQPTGLSQSSATPRPAASPAPQSRPRARLSGATWRRGGRRSRV